MGEKQTDRERQSDRDRDIERYRFRDRQRQTDRQIDRETHREREREVFFFSERMTLATLPVTSVVLLLYISRQHAVKVKLIIIVVNIRIDN